VASVHFAGKPDPANVNVVMRMFLEMAKSPAGDFRYRGAIAAWAREMPMKMGFSPAPKDYTAARFRLVIDVPHHTPELLPPKDDVQTSHALR
jgi:hypothetical protein